MASAIERTYGEGSGGAAAPSGVQGQSSWWEARLSLPEAADLWNFATLVCELISHCRWCQEMCWAWERFVLRMTPRFRAEPTGERLTLFGRRVVGELSSESCWVIPIDEKLSFGRIEKIGRHSVENTWNCGKQYMRTRSCWKNKLCVIYLELMIYRWVRNDSA